MNAGLLRRWTFSIAAGLFLLWVASRKTFYGDSLSSPFLAIAIASVFLIQLRTRVNLREIGLVALFAGLQYWLAIRWLGYAYSWPVIISFVGIAGLLVLALRAIWAAPGERGTAVLTLIPAFLFVASEWSASYFLEWGARIRPKTLDLYLYSFDASLHVQPAFLMGQLFVRVHLFSTISQLIYVTLPVVIGLTFAGCVMRDRANALPAVIAFLITGPIGACFYTLLPALGPIHLFLNGFPWHPLTLEQARRLFVEPVPLPGVRNAMPSLHAAWVFLGYWYARKLSLTERIGAAIYVFFTLCATLGTGEHYFIDLVVAVPFTIMILSVTQAVCVRKQRVPWAAFLYGLGATLAWFALLRYATKFFWRLSPWMSWMACLLTIALGWYFARGLEKAPKVEGVVAAEAKGA